MTDVTEDSALVVEPTVDELQAKISALTDQVATLSDQLTQAISEAQALRQQRIAADDREGSLLAQLIKTQAGAAPK